MKFLCPSCKAKYQIADQKVAGRTLRMTCRQCREEIVIRGEAASLAPPGAFSQAPMPAPSLSSLGADFQRQVAGQPPAPADAGTLDEWHVAINDVPVGPMSRQELGRKIATGVAGPDSLAWREGLDDWLPIRHIAELAPFCRPAGSTPGSGVPAAPPPPLAGPPSAMPGPASHSQAAPPVAASSAPFDPAARAPVAPLGGRMGAAPAESAAEPPPAAAGGIAPLAPARSYESEVNPLPRVPSASQNWAPMFLMVCGGAFILAIGAVLGVYWLPATQQAAAPQPLVPTVPEGRLGNGAAPVGEDPAVGEQFRSNTIELDLQEIDGEAAAKRGGKASTSKSKSASPPVEGKSGKRLTAAQKAKLARMGGDFNGTTANLKAGSRSRGGGASGKKSELTAVQLSKVVSKGKRSLQRCYEAALRGTGSDEAVRMDIQLTVSASGNVSRVSTRGKGLPGMDKCITRTVRMWRFPASSGSMDTKFPIVFQPGA